MCGLKKSVAFG